MVLNFQNVFVPFAAGIDTKIHPAQLPIGKFTQLQNVVFDQFGAMNKRNGYSLFPDTILGTTDFIDNAQATAIYNNTDLTIFDTNYLYSWIPSLSGWANRGSCTALDVTYNQVIANSNQQINPDILINNDIQLYAWQDSRGGIRYTLLDNQTESVLVSDKLLSLIGTNPRCIVFNDLSTIVYATPDGRIQAAVIVPTNPSNPNVYTIASDGYIPTSPYDIATADGYLFVSYRNDDNKLKTIKVNDLFANVAELVQDTISDRAIMLLANTGEIDHLINDQSLFLINDQGDDLVLGFSDDNLWIGYGDSSGNVRYTIINSDLDQVILSPTDLDNSQVISHITGILSTDGICTFYYDNVQLTRPYIKTTNGDLAGQIGAPSVFKISTSLVSKPFYYNNKYYINTVFDTDLQPTYFTLNQAGEVVSKQHQDQAGGFRSGYTVSNVIANNNSFIYANERRGAILSNNNITYTLRGIASSTLNFNTNYHSANLSQTLHITGGILQAYDGNEVTEDGFNVFPENIDYETGILGNIEDGTYSYQITYESTDNTGKIERSAPSIPIQIIFDQVTNSVAFQIPTLNLTKKSSVRIVVYRTRKASLGDPLFYRVSSINDPTLNDPTTDYVYFIDTLSDQQIQSNNILYCSPDTNGNLIELENIAPPNCTLITTFNNRLWLAGLENPNQLWYSKTVVPGEAPAFNDVLSLEIDPTGGDITAIFPLDSNLIIFKKNAIYSLSGIGPTNSGAQNDFNDPIRISAEVGCINPNSLCLVSSKGVFFQSSKGIYLLDRSGSAQPIGTPVDYYTRVLNQNITAATSVPGTTQVRFSCDNGDCLVYDYLVNNGEWFTYTNHLAVDANVWNDLYYFLDENGNVHQETPNQYLDNTVPVEMSVTTGDISFVGILNYQLVNSFLIFGDFIGQHQLQISIANDSNPNFQNILLINTSDLFDINTYGQQNIYGNNGIFGGTFANETFRCFPKYPKCSRMRIKIQEINTEGNAGLTLVGLNVKVGMKQGLDKIAATHQF